MPIIRTYDNAGAFLGLAQQAGQAAGRRDRLDQQRRIDAQFIAQQTEHRNRMAQLDAASRLAPGGPGGGGGGGADPVRDFLSDAGQRALQRRMEREEGQHRADLELDSVKRRRGELLGAIDQAYRGKEKDLAYYSARDTVLQGGELDSRLMYSLGIKSGPEDVALQREARLQAGQSESDNPGAPKTAKERVVRQTLNQGRYGDLAELLVERETPTRATRYGEQTPYTADALAARAQLADFVAEQADRTVLASLRDTLAGKADPATRDLIDARIRTLEQEEVETKAPVAYEQAMETFHARIGQLQRKAGAPVPILDQQRELAKIIETTAKSYGLDVPSFREWYRANQAAQRAARMSAEQPGAAPPQNQGAATAPAGTVPARPVQGTPEWLQQQPEQAGGFVPGIGPQPTGGFAPGR